MNAVLRAAGQPHDSHDPLLAALQLALERHGIHRSPEALLAGLPTCAALTPELFIRAARGAGCHARRAARPLARIPDLVLPVVLEMRDGSALLLLGRDGAAGFTVGCVETGAVPQAVDAATLEARYAGHCYFLRPTRVASDRTAPDAAPAGEHWLWGTLWRYRGYYGEAAIAAVLINLLTLAGTFFVMNVYDRVISNQAYVTLWTLAIGVSVAIGFEFVARCLRGWLLDTAGRKADLVIGSRLFQHALATRLELRPASPGAFASQLREFEAVRDFASSLTLVALTDLPFLLLFLVVIAGIAGPLAWVPVALLPLLALVTGVAQWPLARYVNENQRESALRQGLMVESLASVETLKALRAEGLMQERYEAASAATAVTAMKSRLLTQVVLNFCAMMQSLTTVAMIVWGTYLIDAGELSLGALIGAVILASRSLAPVSSIAALAVRFQQARSALRTLDGVMARPADRDPRRGYLQVPTAAGALTARAVAFAYPGGRPAALQGVDWAVAAGERVGVLGRIGGGKSTLLRVLSGLYAPTHGQVLLDGIDLQQLDPVDARRHVAYVGQEAHLVHGSLRDNLKAGSRRIDDTRMLEVARATGVDAFASLDPRGYDMEIGEGGRGLSGGQRQLVALARALLADPAVLLLDEPTSAMDHATEQQAIRAVMEVAARCTVVLVTHKQALLGFVERVTVLDGGRVVADGPRVAVLQALADGKVRSAPITNSGARA